MMPIHCKLFLLIWLCGKSCTACHVENLSHLASMVKTNALCRHVNLAVDHVSCEVESEDDLTFLMCSARGDCEGHSRFRPCADASYNMTCVSLEGSVGLYYECGCHAVIQGGASPGEWTGWQLSNDGVYRRQLYEAGVYMCALDISTSE